MAITPVPCECGGAPCPPLSSTGLCLADGTPIAVVYTRDCDTGEVAEQGFLNLLTGIFTPGAPPAGTRACGERDYELTNWCDLNPDGTVIAHVLIEYEYDEETGQLVGSRLLDALGNEYNGGNGPVGTLGSCGSADQVFQHQEILCDHRPGSTGPGEVTAATPILAAARVVDPAWQQSGNKVNGPLPLSQAIWDGGAVVPAGDGTVGSFGQHTHFAATLTAGAPECGTLDPAGTAEVNVKMSVRNDGPNFACLLWGRLSFWDISGGLPGVLVGGASGVLPFDQQPFPAGSVLPVDFTLPTPVSVAKLQAGQIVVEMDLEVGGDGGCGQTADQVKAWTVSGVELSSVAAVTDCGTEEIPGPVVPFIRKYIQDVNGAVLDTVDLTFDGLGYLVQGYVGQCEPIDPEQTFALQLCDVQPDGSVVPFVRTYTVNCGEIVQSCDKDLGGIDDYDPTGTVQSCQPPEPECSNCETIEVCDSGVEAETFNLTGEANAATGAFSNGVTWLAQAGNAGTFSNRPSNYGAGEPDGLWWTRVNSFPAEAVGPQRWTWGSPQLVEFSVALVYTATVDALPLIANTVQLPAGVVPVNLPSGYHFDPVTFRVSVDASVNQDNGGPNCLAVSAPQVNTSARFRTTTPATSITLDYLGSRQAVCGAFGNWSFGAFTIGGGTPATRFLRTICRDCDGNIVGDPVDTLTDGVTAYAPTGEVGSCDCSCQPVQVCIRTTTTETVEFVTNEDVVDTGSVDPNWKWAKSVPGATDPADVTQWFPMYNKSFNGQIGGTWATVDSATVNAAGWSAPHPTARVTNTGLPGEGPTLVTGDIWWAKTDFTLPAAADPGSIKVRVTVLNADQVAQRYRWNNGDWVNGGGNYTSVAPYTTPAQTIPGVNPGLNTLYFQVLESSTIEPPTNGAGVKAHFFVTYDLVGVAQRSWTRMLCCDGSEYFLDEDGQRQDTLPDGWAIVPCGNAPVPLVLCDDNGSFIRHFYYSGDQVVYRDTDEYGVDYSPIGDVHACAAGGGPVTGECITCETVQLCDQLPGIPSDPPLTFAQVQLAALANGPTAGVLANGVGFTVSCGEWQTPQNHYTFYPAASGNAPACDQTWTFDQPVYVRFGLRGLNLAGECLQAVTGDGTPIDLVSQSPNHTVDLDPVAQACRTATSTALDESVFVTAEPVTELTLIAAGNNAAGRGPGLVEAALPVTLPMQPGEVVSFLRTTCRDCDGAVVGVPVDTTDGSTPYVVQGVAQACAAAGPDAGSEVFERCGCDDTNSDGVSDVRYIELWRVPLDGSAPVMIGRYVDGDFTQPYPTVINQIDCP